MANSDEQGGSRFAFVLEKNQAGTRNHAMRQYWRERRRARPEARRERPQRKLLPNVGPSEPERREDGSSSEETQINGHEASAGIPTQLLTGVNHTLASCRLDPFEMFPVTLTSEHHKLMHHWLSTHAAMMFDAMPIQAFNPMKDVWFPLDLSNAASFNTIMAHSAAHLASFYGGTGPCRGTSCAAALRFKSDAVRILNQWLGDPERALGNDAFAAVTRLLTFERYWGTPQEWEIHRAGLQSMIEARGGLDRLHDDWRLELVVGLICLMSRPSWFEPTNDISRISDSPINRAISGATISGAYLDLDKIRSLWLISFIQDMRTLMSVASHLYMNGLSIFPSLYDALLFVRTDFEEQAQNACYSVSDYERLTCLFSISVLVQESVSSSAARRCPSSMNSLALLDASLDAARPCWGSSIHKLMVFLHSHFLNFYLDGEQKIGYISQTVDVITHLSFEALRGVEKCLVNMLCRSPDGNVAFLVDDGWTPDSLLSSVHGR